MTNRDSVIDSLRGLSVLLLFIVNVPIWNDAPQVVQWSNEWIPVWLRGFFDGWLYMLFAFAFGASLMYSQAKPIKFYKRMLVLFIIGLIHGVLLNPLDILSVYAVLGSIAFLFRKTSTEKLFPFALIIVFSLPIIHSLLSSVYGFDYISLSQDVPSFLTAFIGQLIAHGLQIFGMMLLGMVFTQKRNYFSLPYIVALLMLFLGFQLLAMYAYHLPYGDGFSMVLFHTGAPLVVLAIVSIFCRLNVAFLASLGQITLSLYLLQSLVGVILFRGLGWQLTVTQELELGLTAIPVWLGVSLLLEKYKPMERIYRLASA